MDRGWRKGLTRNLLRHNVLLVYITFMLEARWFFGNLGLLLVHAFMLLIGSSLVLAAFAPTAIALDARGPMYVSVVSRALNERCLASLPASSDSD